LDRLTVKCDEMGHSIQENPDERRKNEDAATAVILDMVLRTGTESAPPRIYGMIKGALAGFTEGGEPLVDYSVNDSTVPVPAETTAFLSRTDVGKAVTLQFENGDPRKPIVTGIVRNPEESARADKIERLLTVLSECAELSVNGDKLTLALTRDTQILCGESHINLTRGGKIVLEGKDVLSRSWGMNRVEGASVKVN
jgi:Domain of unknown function (DUF6484)